MSCTATSTLHSRIARFPGTSLLTVLFLFGCTGSPTSPVCMSAPTELRIVNVSDDGLTLTWVDASDNEAGVTVWQSTNSGKTFSLLTSVGPDVTEVTLTGLDLSITHYFRIAAWNTDCTSPYSKTVTTARAEKILDVGDTVPDYAAYDAYGQQVSLSDYNGKVRLLYFTEVEDG